MMRFSSGDSGLGWLETKLVIRSSAPTMPLHMPLPDTDHLQLLRANRSGARLDVTAAYWFLSSGCHDSRSGYARASKQASKLATLAMVDLVCACVDLSQVRMHAQGG